MSTIQDYNVLQKYLNFILHGSSFASLNGNVSVIIGVYQKAGVCVCGGGEGGYEKIELHTCSQKSPPPKKKKEEKKEKKHCGQVIEHVITS